VRPAAQLLFGEQREPALDQIELGAAGGRKVQMEARMAHQPALDGRGLVSVIIIQDQVQFQFARHCGFDGFKEAANLTVRWRRWNSPITVPALASSAANRLMVLWRR